MAWVLVRHTKRELCKFQHFLVRCPKCLRSWCQSWCHSWQMAWQEWLANGQVCHSLIWGFRIPYILHTKSDVLHVQFLQYKIQYFPPSMPRVNWLRASWDGWKMRLAKKNEFLANLQWICLVLVVTWWTEVFYHTHDFETWVEEWWNISQMWQSK